MSSARSRSFKKYCESLFSKQLPQKGIVRVILYFCSIIHVEHNFMETKRRDKRLKRNFLRRKLCDNVASCKALTNLQKYTTFCKPHGTLPPAQKWSSIKMKQSQQKWRFHSQLVWYTFSDILYQLRNHGKLCVKLHVILWRYWIGLFLA